MTLQRLYLILTLIPALIMAGCDSHSRGEELTVETRIWSKIDGKSVYSDWKKYDAEIVTTLDGFWPITEPEVTTYGSDRDKRHEATGFFYAKKFGERWWIVDPQGYLNIIAGVAGVRQGNSEFNKQKFAEKFSTSEAWAISTHDSLIALGFNSTGSWSDIPMIQHSNAGSDIPLAYTMIWNFFTSYKTWQKTRGTENELFDVFSEEFSHFSDLHARRIASFARDPNLLGHFSDNELPFRVSTLDEFLSIENITDPNYIAAKDFMDDMGIDRVAVNDSVRALFLGLVADRYYMIVSEAIKKYDPNHLYLGSRLHGRPKNTESVFIAASRYSDIISINYYGEWEPSSSHFSQWQSWADRPVLITEFYTKAMDSGLPNNSGAGWIVRTQKDRGIHYENFCIRLLQMNNCVGWNWFRYMDNDPTDTGSDPSNNDSNKGLVDNSYDIYDQMAIHMRAVNINRYRLIDYFDSRNR